MRELGIAFGWCMGVAVALFAFVEITTGELKVAAEVAALPFIAMPYAADYIRQRDLRMELASHPAAYRLIAKQYKMEWWLIVPIGAIVSLCMYQFLGFVMGVFCRAALLDFETVLPGIIMRTAGVATAPIVAVYYFFLGKWVANRTGKYGVLSLLSIVVLSMILSRAFDYVALNSHAFDVQLQKLDRSATEFAGAAMGGAVVFGIPAALGFAFGKFNATAGYFSFALRMLPNSSRASLLDLVRDELDREGAAASVRSSRKSRVGTEGPSVATE